MKLDKLEDEMRRFETAHDHCVLPELFIVARLDGRGFTKLTKEVHDFEAPFDVRFRDHMIDTACHLMGCGFRVIYAYAQSDEISLLFHRTETAFERMLRKFDSVLAGEASACFSLKLGSLASFDCRISQLPTEKLVVDYFNWRQQDATRNALNGHCYWLLRKQGQSAREASAFLSGRTTAEKNELLFSNGINFNKLPGWQRRGVGIFWENFEREGLDPRSGKTTKATRRRLKVELDLPMKMNYSEFLRTRLTEAGTSPAPSLK